MGTWFEVDFPVSMEKEELEDFVLYSCETFHKKDVSNISRTISRGMLLLLEWKR